MRFFLAVILILALGNLEIAGQTAAAVSGTTSVTALTGYASDVSLKSGEFLARLSYVQPWCLDPIGGYYELPDGLPVLDWGVSAPGILMGALDPVGLAAFFLRPQGAGYRLARSPPRPFVLPRPRDATLEGVAMGAESGIFAVRRSVTTGPAWYGGWVSPAGCPVSFMVAAEDMPETEGDGSWYDPPVAGGRRLWAATSVAGGRGDWFGAAGLASTWGFPGQDAVAARCELDGRFGRLKLALVAAASDGRWISPKAGTAPALDVEATASLTIRAMRTQVSFSEERSSWTDAPTRILGAAMESAGRIIGTRSSLSVVIDPEDASPGLELDCRVGAGRRVRFTVSGSVRARNGSLSRTELAGNLEAGSERRVSAELGWRRELDEACVKAEVSLSIPIPIGRLVIFTRSDGWLPIGWDAEDRHIEVGVRLTFSVPLSVGRIR